MLCFWNENTNKVESHFLDVQYLGHEDAQTATSAVLESLDSVKKNKILSISTDGPYVMLKFKRLLKADLLKQGGRVPSDLGTCTLHHVHNGYEKFSKVIISNYYNVLFFLI